MGKSVKGSTRSRLSPPPAPSRHLRLKKVELSSDRPVEEPKSVGIFSAAGVTVNHVTVTPREFSYQWIGREHYLALHHLQLADGETFSDGPLVEQRRDLRGLLTFVPAGARIWGWSLPRSAGQSFTALYLDPQHLEPELAERVQRVIAEPMVYFADPALRSTMKKLRLAITAEGAADPLYLESLSMLALMELCLSRENKRAGEPVPAGHLGRRHQQRVRDYVEANLGADIGLGELAQITGLSRFHFLRAFKKATSQTPYQYVLQRRIERAQELLTAGDLPVGQIALMVGFKQATPFIRAFRRQTGMTPGVFRERLREAR